jgi:hypothetical protein
VTTIQHWPPGAPSIALCPCGGVLRLVEDPGPKVPVEAQCERCLELTGVSHEVAKAGVTVQAGSVEDFGF